MAKKKNQKRASSKGTNGKEVTIYDPNAPTLHVAFPPPGSPLLDLGIHPSDLIVGVVMNLAKLQEEANVPMHPDVAKANAAITARLNEIRDRS